MTSPDSQTDLIARLIAAGTSPLLVAEVAMALARGGASDARREKERARKARYRAARACPGTGEDETGQLPFPDKESSPRPPKEINPIPVGGEHAGSQGAPAHEGEPPVASGRATIFPRPASVDPATWSDFLRNRKLRGVANTRSTHAELLADIARIADDEWPPGRLIAHATAQGWARVYDPRLPHRTARRTTHAARNSAHGRDIDQHRPGGSAQRSPRDRDRDRAGAATAAEQVQNPRLRAALELEAERSDRGPLGG